MRPHVVVDIGNTRIKWGLVAPDELRVVTMASLSDGPAAWQSQWEAWIRQGPYGTLFGPLTWVLASVQPHRCTRLRDWLLARGNQVVILEKASQLPLTVALPEPDKVGIDRLLNAVAARMRLAAGEPAILIDAGSAVTVDWLNEEHAFCGGAILPGLRLMAEALHRYTALLPLVEVKAPPLLPAQATIPAMKAGIFWAVAGGIELVAQRLRLGSKVSPRVFLTGGDLPFLWQGMAPKCRVSVAASGSLAGLPQPASEPLAATTTGSSNLHKEDLDDPQLSRLLNEQAWTPPFEMTSWPGMTLDGILRSADALP
jgi:type III pantothenate kinase